MDVTANNLWSVAKKNVEALDRHADAHPCMLELYGAYKHMIAREQRTKDSSELTTRLLIEMTATLNNLTDHERLVESSLLEAISVEGKGIVGDMAVLFKNYHAQGTLYRTISWAMSTTVNEVEGISTRIDGFDDEVCLYLRKSMGGPEERAIREKTGGLSVSNEVGEGDKVAIENVPAEGKPVGGDFDPASPDFTQGMLNRKYRLLNAPIVGSSQKDVIWKSLDVKTNRMVVLKFYRNKDKFTRETEALKTLKTTKNRNIIELVTYFEGKSTVEGWETYSVAAMDVCEITLYEYITESRGKAGLTLNLLKGILEGVTQGLHAIHGARLVHCNIKPENIMQRVDSTGRLHDWVIVDLDSAVEVNEEFTWEGSIEYITADVARDVIAGRPSVATEAVDAFALGRLLYFLMTGVGWWPRSGATDEEKLAWIASDDDISISESVIGDRRTRTMIEEMVRKNVKDRRSVARFKDSAFLTGGHDTAEMKSIRQQALLTEDTINTVKKMAFDMTELTDAVEDVNAGVVGLETSVGEIKGNLTRLRTQTLSLAVNVVPRLFLLIPQKKSKLEPADWFREKYTFHFLCEHENPHVAVHPGYPVSKPKEFIVKYGPHIKLVVQMTLMAVKVAGMAAGIPSLFPPQVMECLNSIGTDKDELFGRIQQFGKALQIAEVEINKETATDALMGVTGERGKTQAAKLQEVDMRAIAGLIGAKDKSNSLGNLRRCIHKDSGNVQWMCDHHSKSEEFIVRDSSE